MSKCQSLQCRSRFNKPFHVLDINVKAAKKHIQTMQALNPEGPALNALPTSLCLQTPVLVIPIYLFTYLPK
jgi:hypothetical protein